MYEHIALGYRLSLALCLTKVRSSQACCPVTALILYRKWNNMMELHCYYIQKRAYSRLFCYSEG